LSKKAAVETLKVIIISLAIFLVLFYFTVGIGKLIIGGGGRTGEGDKLACLLSVKAVSSSRGSPLDAFNLQCNTNFYGDIVAKGNTEQDKRDSVNRVIAELMYDCWYEFGKGDFDVFMGKMFSEPIHCFICSKFRLGEAKGLVVKEEDFLKFINGEDKIGTKIKYSEFLDGAFLWTDNKETPSIFIKQIELDSNWLDAAVDWYNNIGESVPARDTIKDEFTKYLKITPLDDKTLGKGQDYAVVYYQPSDKYWEQWWVTKAIKKVRTGDIPTPPASIMVAKYDGIKDLNCGALQG